MLVNRLVPLLVAGGITAHSGGALKERALASLGLGPQFVVKQRIHAIFEAAMTTVINDPNAVHFRSQSDYQAFVRRNVRISNNSKIDANIDPWGTPMRGELRGNVLHISSAGPDKTFGTKDDIADDEDVFDY